MREIISVFVGMLLAVLAPAQSLSDAEIQKALDRGKSTTTSRLWNEIRKRQQVRINRAGFGDPIEKKVTFLFDTDRIALESSEAKRQLRELAINDVKHGMPLGFIEVMLEANCYNNLYAGGLAAWGPSAGVHVVLRVADSLIQPIEERAGAPDSVSIFPQEHGIVSVQGSQVTYTPLYRSSIYERASLRTWFRFPVLTASDKSVTVIVIAGNGKTKEKEVSIPVPVTD